MFYSFSILLVFLSISIKLFAIHFTNFDLFGDEAQYWLWSEKLELGYYSKPPLLAWLLKLHTLLFGSSFESLKYFPLIFYFFTSCIVYFLSLELYNNKRLALVSGISFYLLPSVSLSSFLISTDVVLIFFSSLVLLMILKIRKNPKLINFTILGIFFGLSFLSKYAAIYYIFSLILLLILDKKTKQAFSTNKVNLFTFFFCFSIVLFPNILWNIHNGWITLFHTSDNAGLNRMSPKILQGLEFVLSQAVMLGPLLVMFFIFFIKRVKLNLQTIFLLIFSAPVFFIVLIEGILVRANANWAAIGIIPIFLILISHIFHISKKFIIINNLFNFTICFILFFSIAASIDNKVFDRISGTSNFANILKTNALKDVDYLVVEDRLLYSNLNYYLRDENKTILTPHNPNNKIKSHFHITRPLTTNHDQNFVFIGNPNSLKYLNKSYIIIKKEEIKVKFTSQPIKLYEVFF